MSSATRKKGKKKQKNEDEEAVEKEPSGSFAWKVLPPTQIRSLQQCETPDDLQLKMATVMEFDHHEIELKEACLLDYYVTAFHWAKERNFDERQMSGFITLVSNLLENMREKRMSKSANLTYLKECFSGVGVENPNVVSVPLYFFKLEHAKMIMQYLINTLFYHYSLYEFFFTQQQDELIIGSDHLVETCPETAGPFPSPLEEGLPLEIYEEFVIQHNAKKAELAADAENRSMNVEFTDAVLDALQSSQHEVIKSVPTHELRKIIERVVNDTIIPAKTEMHNKIKEKEAAYLARISRIQIK